MAAVIFRPQRMEWAARTEDAARGVDHARTRDVKARRCLTDDGRTLRRRRRDYDSRRSSPMNGLSAYRPGVLSQQLRAPWRRRIRKPMLYPLSYEGLACVFAQRAGRVLVRRTRVGCLALDGLCRTCAACRGSASHHRPDTRRRLYGAWCRAKSRRPAELRGNDGGWCWLR
jgi:hypothetical protein